MFGKYASVEPTANFFDNLKVNANQVTTVRLNFMKTFNRFSLVESEED